MGGRLISAQCLLPALSRVRNVWKCGSSNAVVKCFLLIGSSPSGFSVSLLPNGCSQRLWRAGVGFVEFPQCQGGQVALWAWEHTHSLRPEALEAFWKVLDSHRLTPTLFLAGNACEQASTRAGFSPTLRCSAVEPICIYTALRFGREGGVNRGHHPCSCCESLLGFFKDLLQFWLCALITFSPELQNTAMCKEYHFHLNLPQRSPLKWSFRNGPALAIGQFLTPNTEHVFIFFCSFLTWNYSSCDLGAISVRLRQLNYVLSMSRTCKASLDPRIADLWMVPSWLLLILFGLAHLQDWE